MMKDDVTLRVASLLSIVSFTLHLTDDIVFGIERGTLSNLGGVPIVVAWLYATLMLTGRRPRYVTLLVFSLLACGIPILHFEGAGVARIAKLSGGFTFVATLLALGITALFSVILSAQGLWNLRQRKV